MSDAASIDQVRIVQTDYSKSKFWSGREKIEAQRSF